MVISGKRAIGMAPTLAARNARWAAIVALGLAHLPSRADDLADRLSTRLLQLQQSGANSKQQNELVWVTDPSLALEQRQLRNKVIDRLRTLSTQGDLTELTEFLEAMPITGRLAPVESDLATLLANPRSDFVLGPRTELAKYQVPELVTVLQAGARPCFVELQSSTTVQALLRLCAPKVASDQAWVIQPDGAVYSVPSAAWNSRTEVLVAPGAWVWIAPSFLAAQETLNSDIANFLATQRIPAKKLESASEVQVRAAGSEVSNIALEGVGSVGWQPFYSSNDWGETGLLQTPTARTAKLGDIRLTASRAYPYTRMNVFMQPTGWLEFGFRYTDIATALYGPNIAGDQTYKDKSLDFKAVLTDEGAYLPQVALGMRDIGGTGLFSSEYLVASKRSNAFDWSIGIGWGNLGSAGTVTNPLAAISPNFKVRQGDVGQGGNISTATMFAGNAAPFGGVQWTSPSGRLALKLEVEGNDYKQEPFGQDFGAKSPFNVGFTYSIWPGTDVSLAFERGNRLAFAVTFGGNLRQVTAPKPLDPAPPAVGQLVASRLMHISPQAADTAESLGAVGLAKVNESSPEYSLTPQKSAARPGWWCSSL